MAERMSRRVALVLAVALAAGCRSLPVSLSETPQSFSAKDYERIFERWTREKQIYNLDTFDNSLTVSSTFRSWQFRQAYVARYADDYGLDGAGREALLAEQRLEYEASNEFLVAATATKPAWADFSREDSPWVISLVNDGGVHVGPASLEKISKPSPLLQAYYPSINVYRTTFLVRFPKAAAEGGPPVLSKDIRSFSLVFAGALGRAELVWKVGD